MPRRKEPERNYALRGVYFAYTDDHVGYAWTRDSLGLKSRKYPFLGEDDEEAVKASLWSQLDIADSIPSGVEVPFRLGQRDVHHLRLL